MALPRQGIPTQPFRAGLTSGGRPSGPRLGRVPEASVLSSTDECSFRLPRILYGHKHCHYYNEAGEVLGAGRFRA